ncbi:MAG: fibronectin type III domain-containing protein [Dactylosporangium sp.]|nr:fibronectin type III domain-containing protein [Dactylosporangium sp.]NNJ60610.1 fibronectin type III domain-containing protein [Dactylosporangium sp.]
MSSTLVNGNRWSRIGFGNRARWSKGSLVTVATIVALVVVLAATLFGLGAANHAVASFDASSWLFSKQKGEVARVNGVTGKVDTRTEISDSKGHTMQVTQNDRFVILRDLATGKVSVLDLSSLQISASTQTTPGLGVTVALHEEAAFVIDAVQGVVRQLNPATLVPAGQPLNFPPGISGGLFDSKGRLWILVASEGTAVAVKPASLGRPVLAGDEKSTDQPANAADDASASGNPTIDGTVAVADPSHELVLSVLDTGVAVLDKTTMTLITVNDKIEHTVALPLSGPGDLPARTVGRDIPVTVVDDRHVYIVNGDTVTDFAVPGDSPNLQPCTAWSGRFYCPDDTTGAVYVLTTAGQLVNTITVPNNGVALELEAREGRLFINAPGTANARVVDDEHEVKTVNKYVNDVLGGDPPPVIPPPTPPKPPVGPPSAPTGVKATAGNAQARLTWRAAAANGFPIIKYVIEGDGKTHETGANQRALDITELTNGQKYTFTVYAVNAKGNGPKRASNPVVPTNAVPRPPASVTAAAKPNGTVAVSWPAADGQGGKVVRYDITAIAAGQQDPVGSSTSTGFTVPASTLAYGTQYGFIVTAVNDSGASSDPSTVSNTVVPYTAPGKPAVTASTATDKQGTIAVNWTAPATNGRPITKYVVTAGGVTKDVSSGRSTSVSGLADGATITVKVHAVNEAGAGADGTTTAKTIEEPTVSGVSATATATALTVKFTAGLGGASTSTCSVTVSGKSAVTGTCGSITVSGLTPSTSYPYTVKVSTPAGSATAAGTQSTKSVTGVAFCQNNTASSDPAQHAWCDDPDNALEVQSNPAALHSGQVGRTTHKSTYTAYCYTTGINVRAYVYNNYKDTNIWVKISFAGGQYYTPLAWFNVGGNNTVTTGALPRC